MHPSAPSSPAIASGAECGTSTRRTSLAGLIFALGVASLPIGSWDNEFADTPHLIGNELIWGAVVGLLLLYVTGIERRPLSSIGLKAPGFKNIGIGIALGLLTIALLGVLYLQVLPALHLDDHIAASANAAALLATPFWWRFLSTIRAAVAEEILFRGYAMQRIEELTGSKTAATLISCAVFTAAHLSTWGSTHTLIVAIAGLTFSLAYLWRRNLWVNIIAHFMVDAISVLT
jgi:membrane protease YdiL (CAAX protease family)